MFEEICRDYEVNSEQAEALDININTGLKAGAGSGKTRVLSKRFFKLLKEVPSIELDSIAAITFTRKAAMEMKERIRKEIYREIEREHDREKKLKWKRLRDLITTANIDTIHGFCSSLIKDNFATSGIDPCFTVIEEVDSHVKLQEFLEKSIIEYIEDIKNNNILDIVFRNYGTKIATSGELTQDILKIYRSMREKGSAPEEITSENNHSADKPSDNLKLMGEEITKNLHKKYEDFKVKKSLLDFNDLEILSEKLLSEHKDVKSRYFERFKYFLVDEFQDVNPIQEKILSHLTEYEEKIPGGRLFIVGDHKQSIYGFRGTDYKIFDLVCNKIAENGEIKNLSNCYRSTLNIVDTVNIIFEKLIDPFEKLTMPPKNTADASGNMKVELITWKKGSNSDDNNKKRWDTIKNLLPDDDKGEELKESLNSLEVGPEPLTKKDYQGSIIAGRTEKLLQEGFNYKDIAILLRSRRNLKFIENALYSRNIPYCVMGGVGFWGKQEIIDIISLYKYVFNPSDTVSFLTVLRSPVMGFSDDMVFKLMENHRDSEGNSLMASLADFAEKSDGHEAFLSVRSFNLFQKCLKLKGTLNSYELIKRLCEEADYGEILLSLQGGEQKYRNLEKLFSIVIDFERKNIYNPGELPLYMESMEENGGLDEEASLDTEDSDAVKILTIHASKGLEFESVIIPDIDRNIDYMSKRNKPLFYYKETDKQKEIIPAGINEKGERDVKANSEYYEIYNNQLLKENDDSRRILYVAATRAKKFLAFIGEDQEIPDKDDPLLLNSSMKQLKWAIKDINIDTMKIIDGEEVVREKTRKSIYPPDFATEAISCLENMKGDKKDTNLIKPYENPSSGYISISRYQKYLTCARLYYFQYLARIDHLYWSVQPSEEGTTEEEEEKPDGALRGNIVHEILSNLDSFSDKKMNEKIDELIKKTVSKNTSFKSEDDIRKYIVNYMEIEKNLRKSRKAGYMKSLCEYKFLVPLEGNIMLSGIADRVDLYENNGTMEAVIIEYKTDTVRNIEEINEKIKFYTKQLYAYMYALEKITFREGVKTRVNKAYIYFLQRGIYEEIEKDDSKIEELRKELVNSSGMLLGRRGFDEYSAVDCKTCSWCDYRRLCEKSERK